MRSSQTKALSTKDKRGKDKPITVARAAGMALKAYYKGAQLTINVNERTMPNDAAQRMDSKAMLTVYISDLECPSIEKWV